MPDVLLTCIDCDWTGSPEQCVAVVNGKLGCPICGSEVSEEETPIWVEIPT